MLLSLYCESRYPFQGPLVYLFHEIILGAHLLDLVELGLNLVDVALFVLEDLFQQFAGTVVAHYPPFFPLHERIRSPSSVRTITPGVQSDLYSVVLPSKCSLSFSASARVWWTTPSR